LFVIRFSRRRKVGAECTGHDGGPPGRAKSNGMIDRQALPKKPAAKTGFAAGLEPEQPRPAAEPQNIYKNSGRVRNFL